MSFNSKARSQEPVLRHLNTNISKIEFSITQGMSTQGMPFLLCALRVVGYGFFVQACHHASKPRHLNLEL